MERMLLNLALGSAILTQKLPCDWCTYAIVEPMITQARTIVVHSVTRIAFRGTPSDGLTLLRVEWKGMPLFLINICIQEEQVAMVRGWDSPIARESPQLARTGGRLIDGGEGEPSGRQKGSLRVWIV